MSGHVQPQLGLSRRWLWALVGCGVVSMGAGLVVNPARAFTNLLVDGFLVLSMALGAMVFLALMQVANAGWHTAFKRVLEAMGGFVPVGAVLILLLLPGVTSLYNWTHHGFGGHVVDAKRAYLNIPFFAIRMVVILVIWLGFTYLLRRQSRQQDQDGSLVHTRRGVATSAVFLVVTAITFSIASFDWLMSVEPAWFSTVFALYHMAGMLATAVAGITIVILLLRRAGFLREVNSSHLHDLGKLNLAFATLWAYMWLSQYLLTWYANLPEETEFYVVRTHGGWSLLFWAVVVLSWAIPFVMLLPMPAKRSEPNLFWAAGFLLVGRWLDLYVIAAPATAREHPGIGLIEVGVLLGTLSAFALVVERSLGTAPLIARNDPYLAESLHHHT